MQWNASRNAGFSDAAKTWLPVAPNYKTVNAEAEQKDPASLWNWYRSLIALRSQDAALRDGNTTVLQKDGDVLAYLRSGAKEDVLVLCNFTGAPVSYRLSAGMAAKQKLMASGSEATAEGIVHLDGFGVWIGQVTSTEPAKATAANR
jgi:alpha-glucosidase